MGKEACDPDTRSGMELSVYSKDSDWIYQFDPLERGYFSLVHARRVVRFASIIFLKH